MIQISFYPFIVATHYAWQQSIPQGNTHVEIILTNSLVNEMQAGIGANFTNLLDS